MCHVLQPLSTKVSFLLSDCVCERKSEIDDNVLDHALTNQHFDFFSNVCSFSDSTQTWLFVFRKPSKRMSQCKLMWNEQSTSHANVGDDYP